MELDNPQKITALISLSNHAYDETKRYRDHVWKVLVWTIGLLVGVLAVARVRPDIATTYTFKWCGSIFIVIVGWCGVWNIHFDYAQFVWNRNLLRDCERILQFYDKDAYRKGTVLPEGWREADYKFKQCLPHYLQWMFVILVVVIYSIYVCWKVVPE